MACIKTRQFAVLFIMQYFSIFIGYFVANQFKEFGGIYITDDKFLTLVGALSSACAGFRFVWAFLMQKYSYRTIYTIIILIQVVVGSTLYWSVRSKPAYLISVCLLIWCEGGHFTTLPTIVGSLFGQTGSQVFPILFINFGLSSMSGVFVAKVLLNNVLGYLAIYLILSGMCLISLVLLWTLFSDEPLKLQTEQDYDTDSASDSK